jgi:hypothetical protein
VAIIYQVDHTFDNVPSELCRHHRRAPNSSINHLRLDPGGTTVPAATHGRRVIDRGR